MNIEEIKELIQVANDTGVAELEVQRGEDRVRIRRSVPTAPQEYVMQQMVPHLIASHPVAAPPPSPMYSQANAASAPAPAVSNTASDPLADANVVKSPIVGTYYESPSPGSPPFVKVGDRVSPGQVLCIIESMKLMNEIEAETGGTVVAKLVENGRPVEYGEALFAIKP